MRDLQKKCLTGSVLLGAMLPLCAQQNAAPQAPQYVKPNGKTLRELAQARGKEFGTNMTLLVCGGHGKNKGGAWTLPQRWETDAQTKLWKAITRDHFTMLSAGWQMFPGHSWVGEREYCLEGADLIINWARDNGIKFHGHGIGYIQRGWPEKLPVETEQQQAHFREIYEAYVRDYIGHFKGRIAMWDILNEHARYGYYDGARGFNQFDYLKAYGAEPKQKVYGLDYYLKTFKLAHEADPQAKLVYLDFGNEIIGEKSNTNYRVARTLKEQGVPLHGIGYQVHQNVDFSRTAGFDHLQKPVPPKKRHDLSDDEFIDSMRENTQRFADLGLEVWATEVDVKPNPVQTAEEQLRRQAHVYRRLVEVFLESDAYKGFKVWGVTDSEKEKWYLFDEQGRAKPAFYAVQDAFEHYHPRVVAQDNFDVAAGGNGWAGAWQFNGAAVAKKGGFTGDMALTFSQNGQTALRAVSLAGREKAHLFYRWSSAGYNEGAQVLVEISRDGQKWQTVKKHTAAELEKRRLEGDWHAGFATITALDGAPQAFIRFRAEGGVRAFRLDDLRVIADSTAD